MIVSVTVYINNTTRYNRSVSRNIIYKCSRVVEWGNDLRPILRSALTLYFRLGRCRFTLRRWDFHFLHRRRFRRWHIFLVFTAVRRFADAVVRGLFTGIVDSFFRRVRRFDARVVLFFRVLLLFRVSLGLALQCICSTKVICIAVICVTKSRTGDYDFRACARARGFRGSTSSVGRIRFAVCAERSRDKTCVF